MIIPGSKTQPVKEWKLRLFYKNSKIYSNIIGSVDHLERFFTLLTKQTINMHFYCQFVPIKWVVQFTLVNNDF